MMQERISLTADLNLISLISDGLICQKRQIFQNFSFSKQNKAFLVGEAAIYGEVT